MNKYLITIFAQAIERYVLETELVELQQLQIPP